PRHDHKSTSRWSHSVSHALQNICIGQAPFRTHVRKLIDAISEAAQASQKLCPMALLVNLHAVWRVLEADNWSPSAQQIFHAPEDERFGTLHIYLNEVDRCINFGEIIVERDAANIYSVPLLIVEQSPSNAIIALARPTNKQVDTPRRVGNCTVFNDHVVVAVDRNVR